MFKLNLRDEDIIMKITVIKHITKKDIASNFIGNLLTAAGGDIASKVHIILVNDAIYLEYKGHAAIGYAEETRDITKIPLSELDDFLVKCDNNDELLEIRTAKKDFSFIRNNEKDDNLALAMSKVINDLK